MWSFPRILPTRSSRSAEVIDPIQFSVLFFEIFLVKTAFVVYDEEDEFNNYLYVYKLRRIFSSGAVFAIM